MRALGIGLCLLLLFTSCGVYRQSLLLQVKQDHIYDTLLQKRYEAENNYVLRPYEEIQLRVYSNEGEEIQVIDALSGMRQQGAVNQQMFQTQQGFWVYRIQADSTVLLPLVGRQKLAGYTLVQADSLLSVAYDAYYKGAFVKINPTSRRVVVFRGQEATVLPLKYEGMTLLEVLAEAGGINNQLRATNIRLVRGDLQNPNVYVIDLTTIEGMRRINMQAYPNDILYVEPLRRPFLEAFKDVSPVVSMITGLSTFIISTLLLIRQF
jgi:polysaccharide export outer membrane protein